MLIVDIPLYVIVVDKYLCFSTCIYSFMDCAATATLSFSIPFDIYYIANIQYSSLANTPIYFTLLAGHACCLSYLFTICLQYCAVSIPNHIVNVYKF